MFVRRIGHEAVFRRARQIKNSFVTAVAPRWTGMTSHHVRVYVDRINGIRNRDAVLMSEDVEDEPAIGFGAVRDEDLIVGDLDAAIAKIMLGDFPAKKFVALVGRITAKSFAMTEFLDRAMHRGDHGRRQRLG